MSCSAAADSGLAPPFSDLAAEYAELIRQEWGQADLMGLGCGGAIAQYIGLDHPDSVESLVLVMSGAKLRTAGRDIALRWLGLVQTGAWALLREELLRCAPDISQRLTGAGRRLQGVQGQPPEPVDAQDFVTVLSALLAHDTSLRLPSLLPRTLVVGGGRDLFCPEAAVRDLAGAIPRSTLVIHAPTAAARPSSSTWGCRTMCSPF